MPEAAKQAGRQLLAKLSGSPHVAGLKQTLRALGRGDAEAVFCADDAQEELQRAVLAAAAAAQVPVARAAMRELGRACGVNVPTAAAALLRGRPGRKNGA